MTHKIKLLYILWEQILNLWPWYPFFSLAYYARSSVLMLLLWVTIWSTFCFCLKTNLKRSREQWRHFLNQQISLWNGLFQMWSLKLWLQNKTIRFKLNSYSTLYFSVETRLNFFCQYSTTKTRLQKRKREIKWEDEHSLRLISVG